MPININLRKQNNIKKLFYPLTLVIVLVVMIVVLILVIKFFSTANSDAFTIDQSLTKSEVIELRKYDFNITATKLGVFPPLTAPTGTETSMIEITTSTTIPTSTIPTSTNSTSTKKKN